MSTIDISDIDLKTLIESLWIHQTFGEGFVFRRLRVSPDNLLATV